ncbi:MAG: hypothetical protein AAFQ17_06660 [Pseudomonadota bacterium]
MTKFVAAFAAVAGTASAQDLILTIDISDPSAATMSAEFTGSVSNPEFASAVSGFDFTLDGLQSISAPDFDQVFRIAPGNFTTVAPGGINPLTATGAGFDLGTGVVNWFAQPPAGGLSPAGAWTGVSHEIASFSYDGDGTEADFLSRFSIQNLAGAAFDLSVDTTELATFSYVSVGQDTGSYELVIIPAPASAGLLGLAGLAAARRRR